MCDASARASTSLAAARRPPQPFPPPHALLSTHAHRHLLRTMKRHVSQRSRSAGSQSPRAVVSSAFGGWRQRRSRSISHGPKQDRRFCGLSFGVGTFIYLAAMLLLVHTWVPSVDSIFGTSLGLSTSTAASRRDPNALRVIVVGHELSLTGAPLCALQLATYLRTQGMDVSAKFIRAGVLQDKVEKMGLPFSVGPETIDPVTYDVLILNTIDVSEFVGEWWLRSQVEDYGIQVMDNVAWWIHELPGLSPFPDLMTLEFLRRARYVIYATRFAGYIMNRVLEVPYRNLEVFPNGSVTTDSLGISSDWNDITKDYVVYLEQHPDEDTPDWVIPPVGAMEIGGNSSTPCQHPSLDATRKEKRAEMRASLKIDDDAVVLVYIGSVVRTNKGFDVAFKGAIQSIVQAREDGTKISAVFVLSDYDTADLSTFRASAAAEDAQILFLEPQESLQPLYAASDILLMTSSVDIFPLVALEGLASGVTTVLSKSTGLIDMCEKSLCQFYEPGNVESLSTVVLRLVSSKTYPSIGQKSCVWARATKSSEHSFSEWAKRVQSFRGHTWPWSSRGNVNARTQLEGGLQFVNWTRHDVEWGCVMEPVFHFDYASKIQMYGGGPRVCFNGQNMTTVDLERHGMVAEITTLKSLPERCDRASSVRLNEYITCAVGGVRTDWSVCSTVFCLNARTSTWIRLPGLPQASYAAAVVRDEHHIHVIGGYNSSHGVVNSHWRLEIDYDNDTVHAGSWEKDVELPNPTSHAFAFWGARNNRIYFMGGEHFPANLYHYGRATEIAASRPVAWVLQGGHWRHLDWEAGGSYVGLSRVHPSCVIEHSPGEWVILGGQHRSDWLSSMALHFNDRTEALTTLDNAPLVRGGVCSLQNNTIYVIGGERGMYEYSREVFPTNSASKSVWMSRVSRGTWSAPALAGA